MVELRTLGNIELVTDGGNAPASVLAQPRRVALFCYLALARPYGHHSRDTILSLFWPELDAAHASHALRQAVYFLRRTIGANSVVSRTDGALAIDADLVWCDARALDQALGEGRLQDALALYRGDLLPGFHVSEASAFERWLDDERVQLRQRVAAAAWSLSEQEEQRGDAITAARWAERAVQLSPADEVVFRRLLQLLSRTGDRAAALRAYRTFADTLKDEFELEPTEETRALVATIRSSSGALHTNSPVLRQPADPAPRAVAAPLISPQRRKPGRAFWLGVALLMAAVYGATLVRRARPASAVTAPQGQPVIAVLPFSGGENNDRDTRLAEGLTDDLITKLARGGGLRVVSATSAFAFRDRGMDTRTLAESLGIENLLEGRLETDGDSVRVNVRLIEARSHGTLWSDSYRRGLRQIFSVEDEIAGAVGRMLNVAVGRPVPFPPASPQYLQAHELFLQARNPLLQRTVAGARQRLELYERAIAADSTYAAAHAGIAHAYLNSIVTNALGLPLPIVITRADAAASRAAALDSLSSFAYDALGKTRLAQYRFRLADSMFQRALRLDPADSRAREHIIWLYVFMGRRAEALSHARIAAADDPLSAATASELARALLVNGNCDASLEYIEGLLRLNPPPLRAGPIAAQCYAQQGRWEEAIAAVRGPAEAIPFTRALLAFFLARAGRTQEAIAIRDSILVLSKRGDGGAFPAVVAYAGFGDFDAAFEWLDKSIDDYSLTFSIMEPAFAELRQQPRFGRIAERLGIRHW